MDLKKLPLWGQLVLVAGIGALLWAVAYYQMPGFAAWGREIAEKEEELTKLRAEIQAAEDIKATIADLEADLAVLDAKYREQLQVLPSEPETGDLLEAVKGYADVTGLVLTKFSPGNLEPKEFYDEFPIGMDVVGRYHDLGEFFSSVSRHERVINVQTIRINGIPGTGENTVRAKFTAMAFVAQDDEGEP